MTGLAETTPSPSEALFWFSDIELDIRTEAQLFLILGYTTGLAVFHPIHFVPRMDAMQYGKSEIPQQKETSRHSTPLFLFFSQNSFIFVIVLFSNLLVPASFKARSEVNEKISDPIITPALFSFLYLKKQNFKNIRRIGNFSKMGACHPPNGRQGACRPSSWRHDLNIIFVLHLGPGAQDVLNIKLVKSI